MLYIYGETLETETENLGRLLIVSNTSTSQKNKHSKYKNSKYALSYHKSEVSFIVFIETYNHSKFLQNYFNYNT